MAQEGISIFSPPASPARNPSPATVTRQDAAVRPSTAVDGVQSSPGISAPQQRWADQQAAITRADPWSDPSIIISKNADGTLSARPRGDGQQNGVPADASAQPQPGGQATIDGDKLKFGDLELTSADIEGLLQRRALEQSRAATLPATADLYQLTLPSDFKMPDGVEWAWNESHPVTGAILARAREIAHANGMSQAAFSEMLALHAANEIQTQQLFNRARASELDKLGAMGPARIDAVRDFIRGIVGDAAPHLLRVLEAAPMASTIVGFERLMDRWVNQHGGGNPGGGRDGASSQVPHASQAEYDAMTYHQKIEYAQRFQQSGGGR
jgi:hypothetical protein